MAPSWQIDDPGAVGKLVLLILLLGCRRETPRVTADPTPSATPKPVVSTVPIDMTSTHGTEMTTTLGVAIDAAGDVTVNGSAASDIELEKMTRAAVAKDPRVRAVISADAKASYGRVIAVTDLVKRNGITKIAFGVAR